ncbi:hypothetical protein GX48_06349 [Paracoccidioides brasiliensis]|nr:hypothetical protein GX48_06349 [Paracoccidioides brasiliensis]
MYLSRNAVPLTVNSKSVLNAKSGNFASAAFHYTEGQPSSNDDSRCHSNSQTFSHTHMATLHGGDAYNTTNNNGGAEEAYNSPIESPPALYVRALYNYTADDQTSLSFRQGDIIQVLNQLDTGWWDGVIGDVRGWFPSNYCAVVTEPDSIGFGSQFGHEGGDTSAESGADDYDDVDDDLDSEGNPKDDQPILLPIEGVRGSKGSEQEEAAFWIPQATSDGRLFYFNTLTGRSTAELPLETPISATESGPRDRTNIYLPEQTRAPPEVMVGGIDREEDEYDGSGSEAEGESLIRSSHGSSSRRRRSFISDGMSPATSLDSMNASPIAKPYSETKNAHHLPHPASQLVPNSGMFTRATNGHSAQSDRITAPSISSTIPRNFLDDALSTPITWNTLVSNMRQAIDAYRRVIMEGNRAQYVRLAEDISDHLRLLLAAGSDTTDNHSGNPSIISTNKPLYPHFRDMMSKFSKLVLSSHIAAADWRSPDSDAKCLQEAEGVLHGVYGYVEVAKQQRGDEISRLVPGFVHGSSSFGGHWQNNNVGTRNSPVFLDHANRDMGHEPAMVLDSSIIDRIENLKSTLAASARRLEDQLVLSEKTVTSRVHLAISDAVCAAGTKVVECFQPWMSLVESIDLAPLDRSSQNPQLVDFSFQKQRAYDGVADLVLSCQAVSAPLGDEWSELRGDTLETRLASVRSVCRQLQNYMTQIGFSLTLLLEQAPSEPTITRDVGTSSKVPSGSIGVPSSYTPAERQPVKTRANIDKAQRFFGDTIPTEPANPWFLNIDHESEVFYDNKGDVPTLKCGTLAGLVEHLTRHDKLDTSFNATFLLTYRSFTTASELFEMLVHRFTLQPPYGLDQADLQIWTEQKQIPIRIRVVNIMKNWFENYWMEPNDDANSRLLQRVYAFVKDSVSKTKTPGCQQLLSLIDQRMRGQDTSAKRMVPTISANAPPSIVPKNMKRLKFLDIDPLEFARQLTLVESRLYAKIKPTECLNKTWQKKLAPDEPDPAANVKALILHSNQLTNWVAEMILHQQDVKRRVVVIKHFVLIADKCRAMNNYSTLTSIISALGTAPIHRLSRTWAQVSARISAILENLRRLMASTKNFGEYREALHLANPPCIPFFGVYLTDLTFIEDGIPSLTQSHLINFNKRAKTAEVIRDIQQYQNAPYLFHSVPELQDYMLSNMQAAGDVHEMYDRSLEVEPREREDEKIARYGRLNDASVFALMGSG